MRPLAHTGRLRPQHAALSGGLCGKTPRLIVTRSMATPVFLPPLLAMAIPQGVAPYHRPQVRTISFSTWALFTLTIGILPLSSGWVTKGAQTSDGLHRKNLRQLHFQSSESHDPSVTNITLAFNRYLTEYYLNRLAGEFPVCLVTAAYVKPGPGRKIAKAEARWLAVSQHHSLGNQRGWELLVAAGGGGAMGHSRTSASGRDAGAAGRLRQQASEIAAALAHYLRLLYWSIGEKQEVAPLIVRGETTASPA
jgi:hypothetical protein